MIQSGNMTEDLGRLFKSHLDRQSRSLTRLPPVKQWTTQLCGDIDIVINRQGHGSMKALKLNDQISLNFLVPFCSKMRQITS